MLQFLGRLHILVLHLPIGFLLLAFLMELAVRRTAPALRPAVGFALFWGMASAVLAAGFGYLLSLGGSYDETLLGWHKWLGFSTAALAVALYFFHKKNNASKFYLPLFGATVLTLVATGHFGGSLTHGSDFLFADEKSDSAKAAPIANIDSALVFADLVLPVLKDKCGGCHNPTKRKGELVVLTKEDLLKGGENGPVLLPDKPAESPLLKNIHLPLEDKYHMPPKGKKQLTDHEKQLLDWWVKAGAPFEKTVAENAMPEALRNALRAKAQESAGPLAALHLSPVSDSKLKKLRSEGIEVYPLATDSPFLQVLFSGKKNLTAESLKKLKSVGENVVQLNLSGSNVDDAMLATVKDLPHLNRLHLEQTAVTDKGLAHLTQLQFLEYLNLYQTQVTDAGLEQLKTLPNLRSVYLWQTSVTNEGIAKFASFKPGVFIDRGIENDSMFGEVTLKPPVFKTSKELFSDTLHVVLESGFAKAKIRYTTDGREPDSTSIVYEKTLVLDASGEVKARAFMPGWTTSIVVSKSFVKVRYQAVALSLARQPNPRYKGEGEKTLIDFQKGGENFRNGKWLGWQGGDCVATLDFGKVTDVSGVTVGGIEDTGGWIFFPKGMRISTSADGKNFKKAKEAKYPVASAIAKPSTKIFSESFKSVQARYVKVEVLSVLKNPKWHPSAGEPCWVFVDEIMVE
ncbi:MAG: discoidin domain-containing protein [Bacteroidetes bacterium]|nr:discoidin domain-containing protein [Bacteroidota bacterium]